MNDTPSRFSPPPTSAADPARGEVLVAIIKDERDFALARDQHWYRIPVTSVEKWLRGRWPPQWLAFYQTKAFGEEAYAVIHYARVLDRRQAYRRELFPDQPADERSHRLYWQLILGPLQHLPRPILSRRYRRITFIPTTWAKFIHAVEINDLSDESSLEDRLWAELKRAQIVAERQEFVDVKSRWYALDFAIYCGNGKLDVETDGDQWHANPERAGEDNVRNNDLETEGWRVLRFNSHQIQEQVADYCLPQIADMVNQLGGVDEGKIIPRRIDLSAHNSMRQLTFDDL
jgi:very-short-patch-repair endonuclease